jgi:glycosyltransferase involved in cell wall biosynthesis
MRILVHDHSGHPFQAELSRELARRGHTVVHSFTEGYVSGKGRLVATPGEPVVYEGIGGAKRIDNMRFRRRLFRELVRGVSLARQSWRTRADITLVSNAQIPSLVVFAFLMAVRRRRWVLWHQDVYAVALRTFAAKKLGRGFHLVAAIFEVAERWCSRRAAAIVVIADSFVPVHQGWGTAAKVSVIPNWAPLDEIRPVARHNAWSAEHGLDDVTTLLYSGTLGLKHDPALLVKLAREVIDAGTPARLVVVTEGAAEPVLREEAARLDVPLLLLPFQPYEQLPEVLGSGDVLVVLLEKDAGEFSVPSKTLSYLCAGRPVLGLLPVENNAAELITKADGLALDPYEESLPAAARWVGDLLASPERPGEVGARSRMLAEDQFALEGCADRFETILATAASR